MEKRKPKDGIQIIGFILVLLGIVVLISYLLPAILLIVFGLILAGNKTVIKHFKKLLGKLENK